LSSPIRIKQCIEGEGQEFGKEKRRNLTILSLSTSEIHNEESTP